MSNLLKIFIFTLILSSCAQNRTEDFSEKRILKLYAKAALYELCNKNNGNLYCDTTNAKLSSIKPEIFAFKNEKKKEVLVLFTLYTHNLFVMFGYNKDRNLEIQSRGGWGLDKEEFIESFLKYGDSFYDPDYYE